MIKSRLKISTFNLPMFPFEIKTLDYSRPAPSFEEGDKVRVEWIDKTTSEPSIYATTGVVISNGDSHCTVKLKTKFDTEEIFDVPKKDIYSLEKVAVRVKNVRRYSEFNSVVIWLNNDRAQLIDLDKPEVVKGEFSTADLVVGDKEMISPTHMLNIPIYRQDFGQGCIVDMTQNTCVTLNPSDETRNFVEKFESSGMKASYTIDKYLYLTNSRRIIVYDMLTGKEVWAYNIDTDHNAYYSPKLITLQGRVFTNTKNKFWELPTKFPGEPVEICIPKPERPIYTENDIFIHPAYYKSAHINPRKEILIDMTYYDDFKKIKSQIIPDKEIIDLLNLIIPKVTQRKLKILAHKITSYISTQIFELTKKYPTIRITFNPEESKSMIINTKTDLQRVIDGRIEVERSNYTYAYLHHKIISQEECLGGIVHDTNSNFLGKYVNGGCHGDNFLSAMFPGGDASREVTKEMLIQYMLGQVILQKVQEISSKILYEDVNGLPLEFSDFFIFDGTSFTKKNYPKEFLNISLLDDCISVRLSEKDFVQIDIDGNVLPKEEDGFPEKNKPYYVESKYMSYSEAVNLEGDVKCPKSTNSRLPSETDILLYAVDSLSEKYRYEEQHVYFFVWKEDPFVLKIPLAFGPKWGGHCHGTWCNKCYIVYDSEYVRFVRIK